MKTNDADWVEDVRRWYFNGGRPAPVSDPKGFTVRSAARADDAVTAEMGYEAAHPSLQAAAWSKPAASRFGTLG